MTATTPASNAASLAEFAQWVASRREAVFQNYRQRLTYALGESAARAAHPASDTRRNRTAFQSGAGKAGGTAVRRARGFRSDAARSALTPEVQAAFGGFIQGLLDAAVHFNRTSCALSNFPGEHHLSKDYTQAILLDIAAARREFSLSANRVLIAKGQPRAGSPPLESAADFLSEATKKRLSPNLWGSPALI